MKLFPKKDQNLLLVGSGSNGSIFGCKSDKVCIIGGYQNKKNMLFYNIKNETIEIFKNVLPIEMCYHAFIKIDDKSLYSEFLISGYVVIF